MSKKNVGSLLVLAMMLAGNGAFAQSAEGNAEGASAPLQDGQVGRIMADEHRILMNDVIYALPQVLEFNGEQRTAEQVLRELEKGDQVRFQSSIENRNGHQTVEVLTTDP